jgi:hypothetical protein
MSTVPTHEEARQGCMRTRSGRRVSLLAPTVADIDINDIAWHLSHINRFGGAAAGPYSVGQHAVRTMRIAMMKGGSPMDAYAALHHDSTEAYVGDMTQPMKRLVGDLDATAEMYINDEGLDEWEVAPACSYDDIEAQFEAVIAYVLGVYWTPARHAFVKACDDAAYLEEAEALMGVEEPKFRIWQPEETREAFMYWHFKLNEEIAK